MNRIFHPKRTCFVRSCREGLGMRLARGYICGVDVISIMRNEMKTERHVAASARLERLRITAEHFNFFENTMV